MAALSFAQQVTFCYAPDLEAADGFYQQVLGLPLVLDQGACRIYQVTREAFVGFCTATTAMSDRVGSGVILTLVVDSPQDVDAWASDLEQRGGGRFMEKPPTHNDRFNIYHLFLRDPNGYLVEIQAFLDSAWPRVTHAEDHD